MTIIATFIGIDRHASDDVRDLTGARRDATALWCLFADSLPDLQATLLRDEEATTEAIRSAIATLSTAGPDDNVIFTFSGHGTPDHRLVTHDTHRVALHDTTIPMAELADAFRTSKAGIILCIIDCCFSGGATARVLDGAPIPRDPSDPFAQIVGKGRIILAAANVNEAAYENATTRHGLLTQAIIHTFTNATTQLGAGEAIDNILDQVRAEAGKLGVTQTPYLVHLVEGGLKLPILHIGDNYRREFPETSGVKVSAAIADLAAFGIPEPVIAEWSSKYTNGLNALQQQAINEGRVLDGDSLLVVAPTSSGKTFIGELASVRAIADHRRAVFLLPYKALVNEKFDQFQSSYGSRLGYRVIRCTGDYGDDISAYTQGKYELAILTYEMFLSLVVERPIVLHNIGLVVLDEAHFITDPSRGITVELLLTYLLSARERGLSPQIITLSAVIGNVNDFDLWLGCRLLVSHQRPVPLVEGVIDRTGTFQYLDDSGQQRTEQLIPRQTIVQRRDKPSAQDVIVPLVRQLVTQGEKIIVFRNQRGNAQGCAKYLANDLNLPAASEAIALLPSGDNTTTSTDLHTCLSKGTAFHTSNLTREEREIVERAFRVSDGPVKVLGATTTVAAGINTPADTVIIAEQEFKGEDGRAFTVAEYKNMAGRAGRLGIKDRGRAVIYAETAHQRQQLFTRYVQGTPEELKSSFNVADLNTWIIRLLAQVESVPATEVIRLLCNSFGGYLHNRRNPKWQQDMTDSLKRTLQQMLSLGLLEEELGDLRLTLLGRACGRSTLSFMSVMRLVELLKVVTSVTPTAEAIIATIQALPELDDRYTPVSNSRAKESVWQSEAVTNYGSEVVRVLQRNAPPNKNGYIARCKRACVLWDWIMGVPAEEIEKKFTGNPFSRLGYGDIRQIADTTRFHLRATREIISLSLLPTSELEEQIDDIVLQLETGIPRDTLDLIALPISMHRGEYLMLRNAGIMNRAQLWNMSDEQLINILGKRSSANLIKIRPVNSDAGNTPQVA